MFFGLFKKRKNKAKGLIDFSSQNNKKGMFSSVKNILGKSSLNTELFSQLEELLITSDVSIGTTTHLLTLLQKALAENKNVDPLLLFKEILRKNLLKESIRLDKKNLNIILVFGINGVGKTTSIAKMTSLFKSEGHSLVVAAADTYRAAAAHQLKVWMDELDTQLVYHEGKSKPSAVVFDALDSALAREKDILIIDTAGRIHSREDLLEELKKLNRMIENKAPKANILHLLVVDATTGQNALSQAKHFNDAVKIDGVFVSKMDSSGRGGICFGLSHELSLPVYFLGKGEKVQNIEPFNADEFVESLFS